MKTITVARKPIRGPVSLNAVKYGTGGINIDICRISTNTPPSPTVSKKITFTGFLRFREGDHEFVPNNKGRWPSNVILEHLPECRCIGTKKIKAVTGRAAGRMAGKNTVVYGKYSGSPQANKVCGYADPEGREEILSWDCRSDCPVLVLDQQSGLRRTGQWNRQKRQAFPFGGAAGEDYETWCDIDEDPGGASRYFKQIQREKSPKP